MIVHPQIRALRGDDTPQRLAQARLIGVLETWRAAHRLDRLGEELERLGAGEPLSALAGLGALMTPASRAAGELVGTLIRDVATELAASPFGQVLLRHYRDGVVSTLALTQAGEASLIVQAFDGQELARRDAPATVSFAPLETWYVVLAGTVHGRLIERDGSSANPARFTAQDIALAPGAALHLEGLRQTLVLDRIEGALVWLKLQRRLPGGEVTREFRLADGTPVHQAAGNPRDSRLELAAALLGRMGRTDAAPLLAAMAEEDGSPALRWQALRECLALDSAAGFAALCRIADRGADALAAPAASLRAQLIARHPELAGAQPCPA